MPERLDTRMEGRVSEAGNHFLVVATEWGSAHGGLSTFNRRLCVQLAAAGVQVSCLVLDASHDDRTDAAERGVRLIEAGRSPGGAEAARLYLRPNLESAGDPDVIVGHARITGPAAHAQGSHFPQARRLHFLHMIPDDMERHKTDSQDGRAEDRHQTELELCENADYAVAVGPRIHSWFLRDLEGRGADTDRLLLFVPGFEAEDTRVRRPPAGEPWMVLLVGRAEDEILKGLDLAAAGFSRAAANLDGHLPEIELVLRGAPEGTSQALVEKARKWARDEGLNVRVKPYTDQPSRLAADLRSTSLVLMPSRAEGFGLVGVEAIVTRTPVLVSSASGLGRLLKDTLPPEHVLRNMVATTADDDATCNSWAHAIEAVLRDRDAAFRRAEEVQEILARTMTWPDAVSGLLTAIGIDDKPRRAARAKSSTKRASKGRLLIVEDRIGPDLVRTLRDYECKLLVSFDKWIEFLEENELDFDLAIVDRHLTESSDDDLGLQILDYLRDYPFPRLLMTIDPPSGLYDDVEKKYQAKIYKKDNTNTDIRAAVRKLLGGEC